MLFKRKFVAGVLVLFLMTALLAGNFVIEAAAAFSYEHDPRLNPSAMADIVEDAAAVYGFRPSETGSLKQFASADWSDPAVVEQGRQDRIAYHDSIAELYDLLGKMRAADSSIEEIARAVSTKRNELRLAAYDGNPDGLATVKARNLEQYGHEEGPTPDELYEKYGSWEMVLERAFSANSGMDACLGLYDDYYDLYVLAGQVESDSDDYIARETRISYLGPEGTYTEEATRLFFEDAGVFLPKTTVKEAIASVLDGSADYAVIPQENTLGGAVTDYVDALIAQKDIYVVGEVVLPISQTLMGIPGTALEDIKTVCSHSQGITQSAAWREEHLPDARTEEMSSTAAAAKYVAEQQDKTIAAVAAPAAADLYGLAVLAENVQITEANKTRFYVLSTTALTDPMMTRVVLVADCEANRIDDIIVSIHNAGLELVTIHDRPEGSALGHYYYIIELEDISGISEEELSLLNSFEDVRFVGKFNLN